MSHLRTLVSGIVKTLGGLAAIFAVDASPAPGLLLLIFLWLFLWEIGGQNVPADWHDIEEDIALDARTVPVSLGPRKASIIVLATLSLSIALSAEVFQVAPLQVPFPLYLAILVGGVYLLFIPAVRLYTTKNRDEASALFNLASYYPLLLFMLALLTLVG